MGKIYLYIYIYIYFFIETFVVWYSVDSCSFFFFFFLIKALVEHVTCIIGVLFTVIYYIIVNYYFVNFETARTIRYYCCVITNISKGTVSRGWYQSVLSILVSQSID